MNCEDQHAVCRKCRDCTREQPCGVCSGWSNDDWNSFTDFPRGRTKKSRKLAVRADRGKSARVDPRAEKGDIDGSVPAESLGVSMEN